MSPTSQISQRCVKYLRGHAHSLWRLGENRRWLRTCSAAWGVAPGSTDVDAAWGTAVAAVEGIRSCWETFGGPVGRGGIWLVMLAWYLSMYPQSWDIHVDPGGGLVLFHNLAANFHRTTDLGEDEKVGAKLGWKDPACKKNGDVTCGGSSSSLSCMATSRIQLMTAPAFLNSRLGKLTSTPLT